MDIDINEQVSNSKPTEREKELVRIIEANPTISQSEIAERMGITRSSVSVNITNLMKKGIIKGRGYVLAKQGYPVVIGTANYDCIATTEGPLTAGEDEVSSGHVRFNITYAGFAKIVSEILARFEASPLPLFVVGNDLFGAEIVKELHANNISVDEIVSTDNTPTSMYFELFDNSSKKRVMHLSNSDISQCITIPYLKSRHHILRNASFLALEDAVPIDSAAYLFTAYPNTPRYLLGLVYSHVLTYRDSFRHFNMITISQDMLERLTGISNHDNRFNDDEHIVALVQAFLADGPKSVLIPYAGKKLCFATEGSCYLLSNDTPNFPSVSYEACRTAVFAAFLYYESVETPLLEKLNYIAAAQMLSSESADTNKYMHDNISSSNINTMLKNSSFGIKCINY